MLQCRQNVFIKCYSADRMSPCQMLLGRQNTLLPHIRYYSQENGYKYFKKYQLGLYMLENILFLYYHIDRFVLSWSTMLNSSWVCDSIQRHFCLTVKSVPWSYNINLKLCCTHETFNWKLFNAFPLTWNSIIDNEHCSEMHSVPWGYPLLNIVLKLK